MRKQISAIPAQHQVVVHVHAPAADVKKVVAHWGTVEAVDDQSCRLLMSVDTFEWPTVVLAAVAADFDVLEPPELRGPSYATICARRPNCSPARAARHPSDRRGGWSARAAVSSRQAAVAQHAIARAHSARFRPGYLQAGPPGDQRFRPRNGFPPRKTSRR